jgi:hypothetical protein
MNCKAIRDLLLQAEQPDQPPGPVTAHLARCASCRQWQARLLEIERSVPRLPVPASRAKAKLLSKLEREPVAGPAQRRVLALLRSPAMGPAVLAASLLIFASWWMMQGSQAPTQAMALPKKPAPDQFVADLMQRNLKLAQAKTRIERVEILADLADDLRKETDALAAAASIDDLTTLAQLYQQVVREGVVERAQALNPQERRQVLDRLATRLDDARKEALQRAGTLPKESAVVLHVIASAASDGHDQLMALLKEKS